jgi:hypothetical protein
MKWLFALIIAIVLLSGFWIRWQLAINDPLWIDELHTSWVLSGRWSDIAPRAIAGNQSPLYFWFSYPIVQSLGQSPISLRLLSLVAGCLLPLVGTWAVWSRTGSLLGAFATAVGLSFESHLVFYASEARPYSLVQFGGLVLACTVFARFEGHDSGTHWSSLLLAMVLVLLHPTAILLTVSLALLLFVGRCFPQRRDDTRFADRNPAQSRDVDLAWPPRALDGTGRFPATALPEHRNVACRLGVSLGDSQLDATKRAFKLSSS